MKIVVLLLLLLIIILIVFMIVATAIIDMELQSYGEEKDNNFLLFSSALPFLQSTCFLGHQIRKDHISTTHQQWCMSP